jgi:hypothetical protein
MRSTKNRSAIDVLDMYAVEQSHPILHVVFTRTLLQIIMSEFRWAGKVALVTGGNSGIGAAITRRLLKLGLIVVALDRNIDDLQVCMQATPYGRIRNYRYVLRTNAISKNIFRPRRLERQRNLDIRNRLKVNDLIQDKLYQNSWLDHLERMCISRLNVPAVQYQPWGRRDAGRPKKRWKDQEQFQL